MFSKGLVRVLGAFCLLFTMVGVPFGILCALAERAETSGYSALGHGLESEGHNYGVFRQSRMVYLITGLAPAKILERDGKLVRTNTVMRRGAIATTYSPATSAEVALWQKYFGT